MDSIFVGHEHANSSSIVYEGIRCQFGQKSSLYDQANYLQSDGTIKKYSPPSNKGTPLVGGTVIVFSNIDASLRSTNTYLCQ